MPLTRHLSLEDKRITFTATGTLHLAEMMQALIDWYQDADFSTDIGVLCDFLECDWLPMFREFSELPDAVEAKINAFQSSGKVAFVLSHMTERIMMEDIHLEGGWTQSWSYFDNVEEAKVWLAS